MSYRLTVFDGLPRTGLPDQFASHGEYQRLVGQLTGAGLIKDPTMIWWDIRPSAKYPTLEMRMTDVCTRLEDSITVAALYACIVSMLYRLRRDNQRWRIYPRSLVDENRWLAQRFGYRAPHRPVGGFRPWPYGRLPGTVGRTDRTGARRRRTIELCRRGRARPGNRPPGH